MQPIFFNKAGNILLERYRCGKPSRADGDAIFHHGAVVSITPTVAVNTTPLADGNSDWDAAEPVTGREGSLAVELSFMSPELYAFLIGTKLEDLTNEVMTNINYEVIVPEVAPFTVTLPHEAVVKDNKGVLAVDYNNKRMSQEALATELTTGQFHVADSVVTFSEADAGKAVYLTYDWIALKAKGFNFPKSGTPYAFRVTISGEAMSDDESTLYDTNIVIDRSKATGNINPPPLSKTPAAQTITLKVMKPRGDKAVDFKFAPRDGECS